MLILNGLNLFYVAGCQCMTLSMSFGCDMIAKVRRLSTSTLLPDMLTYALVSLKRRKL